MQSSHELKKWASIGVVTALPLEHAAVRAMFDHTEELDPVPGRGAGRRYHYAEIPAKGGGNHAVVLGLGDVGNNIASARATLLLEHFPTIESILMVGIAGGVPHPKKAEEHVRLGDIVVSDRYGVIQYDLTKETSDEITHRNPPRPPNPRLLEAVRLLASEELTGHHPLLNVLSRPAHLGMATRPAESSDVLVDSTDPTKVIPHPLDLGRVPGQPRIFVGPIASASTLLRNPQKRDELRDRFGVKAIEMEGSGIADATWNHEVGYLVIRGICDYCDSKKSDLWQHYAAIVAAAYMRVLIESIPASESNPSSRRDLRRILDFGRDKASIA